MERPARLEVRERTVVFVAKRQTPPRITAVVFLDVKRSFCQKYRSVRPCHTTHV